MLQSIYDALERPHLNRYGKLVQKIILFNIIINITFFMISFLFHPSHDMAVAIKYISTVTVIIFLIELILRYVSIGQDPRYRGLIGRVKYTFTFYTLIDIISLIPFFATSISANVMVLRILRFLRFLRVLKLLRMKKFIKKFFSINSFASSSLTMQIVVLFTLSVVIILLFSYVYKTSEYSVHIFMDPSYITQSQNYLEMFFGIVELVAGLFIGGALISIITSMLVDITNSINNGYLPYRESGHIVIISYNSKLEFILEEINKYFLEKREEQDIVLFLPDIAEISTFKKNINKYESLDITFMAGEALNWNSYERININNAQKIVMLLSEESEDKGQNRKIARFILSHPDFTNFDADFVIETVKLEHSRDIYDYIFKEMKNRYSLVDNSDLMSKFLNRSIINQDYFQIYSELLSFDGSEFYQLDNRDVFGEKLSFIEANQRFEFGILIGFMHNSVLKLNPKPDMMIEPDDVLVAILEDTQSYSIKESYTPCLVEKKIHKPHLRENKKICIVGDYSDIDIFKIRDFLTDESIKAAQTLIKDEYFDKKIWENLRKSDVDIIILNLEDEYEFALSLYLKNIYTNDQKFLSKIVNIIHSPLMAKLIQGKDRSRNIILSKKIAGEYLTQVMFNPSVVEIFDEITQAKGSEFYVLTFKEYPELSDLKYSELKELFVKNEMVYIGGFVKDEFVFDLRDLKDTDRIVVLAQGVQK